LQSEIPIVSVVIPAFNRAHAIGEAIASVLTQTFTDFEVIVIDDGSNDNTGEVVGSIRDSRLRYVRQENQGPGAARNRGVDMARGHFVSFLDSDDLWLEDKLAHTVAFLQSHDEIHAVFHDLEWQRGFERKESFIRAYSPQLKSWLGDKRCPDGKILTTRELYLLLLKEVPIKPSALTILKSAFERCGGFNRWSSAEDWEFLLRYAKDSGLGYVDRSLGFIRLSGDSAHVMHSVQNFRNVCALLEGERDRVLTGDDEALDAVRVGIVDAAKQMSWQCLAEKRPLAAARVCLKGYTKTYQLELLARAVAFSLIESPKQFVNSLFRAN
jgi:Glycosyl transferase family 2